MLIRGVKARRSCRCPQSRALPPAHVSAQQKLPNTSLEVGRTCCWCKSYILNDLYLVLADSVLLRVVFLCLSPKERMQVSNSFCSWSLILCVCVFSEMLGELARKEKHGSLIQSFYSLFTVLLITVIGTHISRSGCRLSHASS